MPFDLSVPDLIALAWFFAAWGLYTLLVDYWLERPVSLNRRMGHVRGLWMRTMLRRDNRVMDGMLLGHLISSVSFFASTTVLVLAGLLGVLASADRAHRVVTDLGFTQPTSRGLFELKLLLLIGIFTFAFFKFTWSLRQFNYSVALVGAVPLDDTPEREAMADSTAAVLSMAVRGFNGGLRAYYFAFAALGWFVHPWAFMAVVAWIIAVLARRHFASAAHGAVGLFLEAAARRPG